MSGHSAMAWAWWGPWAGNLLMIHHWPFKKEAWLVGTSETKPQGALLSQLIRKWVLRRNNRGKCSRSWRTREKRVKVVGKYAQTQLRYFSYLESLKLVTLTSCKLQSCNSEAGLHLHSYILINYTPQQNWSGWAQVKVSEGSLSVGFSLQSKDL